MTTRRKSLRSAAAGSSSSPAVDNEPTPGPSSRLQPISQLISQLDQVQVSDGGSSDSDDPEEEAYGDMHRLVLQGMIAAGFLDAKGVKKLFLESCKQLNRECPADALFPFIQKVVQKINERIRDYSMVIHSASCEMTGAKFYVLLVTNEETQVMKLQTYFTKTELELFKKIEDTLLRKHNFAMSVNEAINMGGDMNVRGFSKVDAEDFVLKMISLQYFAKVMTSEDDYDITLGFRTIRELEQVYKDRYKDCFTSCCLCKNVLLNGLECPSPKCNAVAHRGCLRKYITTCKTCVSCNCPWKTEKALIVRTRKGSDHDSDDDDETTPSQTISPGTPASQDTDTSQSQGPTTSKKARVTRSAAPSASTGGGDATEGAVLEPLVSLGSAVMSQGKRQTRNNKNSAETLVEDAEVSTLRKAVLEPVVSPESADSSQSKSQARNKKKTNNAGTPKKDAEVLISKPKNEVLEPIVSSGSAGTSQGKRQTRNTKNNAETPVKDVEVSTPKKKAGPASVKQAGRRTRKNVILSDSSESD